MPTPEQDLIARLGAVRSPHLQVDVASIVRDGERRTVRRRVLVVALAACFVVLAGIGFGALRPGGFLAEPVPPAVPTYTETGAPPEPEATDGVTPPDGTVPDASTDEPGTTDDATEGATEGEPGEGNGPPEIGWVAEESDSLVLEGIDIPEPGDGSTGPPDVITISREEGDTSTTVTFEGGTGTGEPIPLEEPMTGPEIFREGESVLVLWPMAPESTGRPVTVGEDGGSSTMFFGGWDVPSIELAGQTLGYRYVPRAPAEWDVLDVVVDAGEGAGENRFSTVTGAELAAQSDDELGTGAFVGPDSSYVGTCRGDRCQIVTDRLALWSDLGDAQVAAVVLPAGSVDATVVAEGGGDTPLVRTTTLTYTDDLLFVVGTMPRTPELDAAIQDGALFTVRWDDESGQAQELEPEERGPAAAG